MLVITSGRGIFLRFLCTQPARVIFWSILVTSTPPLQGTLGTQGHLATPLLLTQYGMGHAAAWPTELSISYIDHNVPRSTRKAQLADLYGFACQCQLCGSQREEPKVTYKSHGKPQGGRPPKSAKGTRR